MTEETTTTTTDEATPETPALPTVTKAQLAKALPAPTANPITLNAAAKALGWEQPIAKQVLAILTEKGMVETVKGKYRIASAKAKAPKAPKRVADADRKKAASTVSKEGTMIDAFDGKEYPVTSFPTYKNSEGETVRRNVTRANAKAYAEKQRAERAAAKEAKEAKAKQ